MQQSISAHLRNTLLAGAFAAAPIAVTAFVIWWVDDQTRVLSKFVLGGRSVPFLGVVLAVLGIYLLGLACTSFLGRFFLKVADAALSRVPGLKYVYSSWKHVTVTPDGTEGMYSKVALVPIGAGATAVIAFTSGRPVNGQEDMLCVFVPTAPNPINGQLHFVRRERCQILDLSAEEAFKLLLSGGNYIPNGIGQAADRLLPMVTSISVHN
jgi:uncharacterized membrane protein